MAILIKRAWYSRGLALAIALLLVGCAHQHHDLRSGRP